jgi:2,5-dihydroxypyridine 5,6-dioxygenase
MLQDRIEDKWIDAFERSLALCKLQPHESVAILSETQSRPVLIQLAELAAARLGVKATHFVIPTPPLATDIPVRSTGGTMALQGLEPLLKGLTACDLIVDLTVEGLLHAPERPRLLENGTRVLMVSNEHPEALERLVADPALKEKVALGVKMAGEAEVMRVTSDWGTDVTVKMAGAMVGGGWGAADEPGKIDYWPGGLCAFYPQKGAVNGTVAMAQGDMNLTFKRYLEGPITFTIEDDYITDIAGDGVDAELVRSYFGAWQEREGTRDAYATAHLGWGMNPKARWDAMQFYDRRDYNGTEARAFAGNFLFSTGANHFANRWTLGHFDLPMRDCSIALDDAMIVDKGVLLAPLA